MTSDPAPSFPTDLTYAPAYPRLGHGRPCARPNCRVAAVVTFDWRGIVLSFCANHAEEKAGEPRVPEVVWLAASWAVCRRCDRVLPVSLVAGEHFTIAGVPCLDIPEPRSH